jgi:glycosyltransferase involved in cell wall biosynthesis
MKTLLFVNHADQKCGVYQYGLNVFSAMQKAPGVSFDYVECKDRSDLIRALEANDYLAVIYNYYDGTLSFVDPPFLKQRKNLIHICLAHEMTQEFADRVDDYFFDFYLYGDPTLIPRNPRVFSIPRLIPQYENRFPLPSIPTIGAYGFAGKLKGFEELVDLVQREFDEAIIRINIPINDVVDRAGKSAREYAARCHKKLKKQGISLRITHEFFSQERLLDFLAANSINVFPYKEMGFTGISSAVDQALAVNRPIAVSNCYFFRHLHKKNPSAVLNVPSFSLLEMGKMFIRNMLFRKRYPPLFQSYVPSLSLFFDIFIRSKLACPGRPLKKILESSQSPHFSNIPEEEWVRQFSDILVEIEQRQKTKN